MKRPNFLKTKRQRYIDDTSDLFVALIKLGVAVKERQQYNRQKELEAENIRLKNRLLEKQINNRDYR